MMLVIGASNILLEAYYRIPRPIEPMKALAIHVLANRWDTSLMFATAFGTAILWLFLSLSGLLDRLLARIFTCSSSFPGWMIVQTENIGARLGPP
ncbi:MAG: hypothetical protein QXD04_07735 [Candidatus Bathyarchaeia archaeon]